MDSQRLPLTEEVNPSTRDLDLLGTSDLLHRINDEDRRAAWAVEREIDLISTAVDEIAGRLRAGGRLHYFGAGTSGRIAVLDAAEIPPTFSARDLVIAHIAGGDAAMTRSVEAAEDDEAAGRREAAAAGIGKDDAVVGISASGSASYVLGALAAAKGARALTVGLTNSPNTPLTELVHIPIVLRTGAEAIAGSTRMKAAAAQKMALTMLSSAVMVKLGKVYDNRMVDVQASNHKLRDRAERLTADISGVPLPAARAALQRSGYRVKAAIVMLRRNCDVAQADMLLAAAADDLRKALTS